MNMMMMMNMMIMVQIRRRGIKDGDSGYDVKEEQDT